MGIYAERITRTNAERSWPVTITYSQPLRHRLIWQLAQKVFYFKPVMAIEPYLDAVLERLHHVRCHDDCHTGEVSRRKPGVTEPSPLGEGRKEWMAANMDTRIETYCGRLPLAASMDVTSYHLSQKGRQDIFESDGLRVWKPGHAPAGQGLDWAEDESMSAQEIRRHFIDLGPSPSTGP